MVLPHRRIGRTARSDSWMCRIFPSLASFGWIFGDFSWWMSRSWSLGIGGIGISLQDVQRIPEVRFFDEIRNGRIEVNVIHVTKVVASNRWEVAVNSIQQMMDEGIAADRICYNALVNACSDRWQISLKLQKKIDTRGFSAMMAYARDMSWRKVHEVLQSILEVCMQVDIVTGNAALTALDKAKRWEGSLQFLREALHESSVDSVTFTSSISSCATLGTWQRAGILLEEMSWTRVLWDVRTLNSALLACERGQLWRGCIALVEAMLASSLRLDEATLNAVSSVGAMSEEPRQPRAQPWQTSLQQLCSWWQTGAIRLFPLSLSSTLRVCEASNQWAVAAQLFEASKSATHPAYHPSIFNAMTLTANDNFGWQGTLHVLDMMKHISCRPNIISFNSLLGVCEKCLAWERALDFTIGHQIFGASKIGKRSFDAILSASTKTAAWTVANSLLEDGGLLESRVRLLVWYKLQNSSKFFETEIQIKWLMVMN